MIFRAARVMTISGAASDRIDGGLGYDHASYNTAASGVTADIEDTTQNLGEAAGDRFLGIEGLCGSGFDDILKGDAAGNNL